MPRGAKNHRFHAGPGLNAPVAPISEAESERRRGADRRASATEDEYRGVDRRQGPRRQGDLRRPVWHQLIGVGLAIALGVSAGLAFGSMRDDSEPAVEASAELRIDPALVAKVQTLRDEAEALTPAAVALDERAHELWMPRVAEIEHALADPETPEPIRVDLEATLDALERVGVLRP